MIKRIKIFIIMLILFISKLSATAYDGLFDVKINDWYVSVQWGLNNDLEYLSEKSTYYKILNLISNNYEVFERQTDSLIFYVDSESSEIKYYLNDKDSVNLIFNNKIEFIDCIYKQILKQYNLTEKSNYFYLYSIKVPDTDEYKYFDFSEVNLNVFEEMQNEFKIFYFLNLEKLKYLNNKRYKIYRQKIIFN